MTVVQEAATEPAGTDSLSPIVMYDDLILYDACIFNTTSSRTYAGRGCAITPALHALTICVSYNTRGITTWPG